MIKDSIYSLKNLLHENEVLVTNVASLHDDWGYNYALVYLDKLYSYTWQGVFERSPPLEYGKNINLPLYKIKNIDH